LVQAGVQSIVMEQCCGRKRGFAYHLASTSLCLCPGRCVIALSGVSVPVRLAAVTEWLELHCLAGLPEL
jgi:hypothetical protein